MKIPQYWYMLPLAALALFPGTAPAQGTQVPPPPCCNEDGFLPGEPPGSQLSPVVMLPETHVATKITVSDSMVTGLGLSRMEMLERLRSILLPIGEVEVTYYRSRYLDPGLFVGMARTEGAAGENAEAARTLGAEVTTHYRIPWHSLRSADFESLDHLYLSAGGVVVEVTFLRSAGEYAVR